MKKLLLAMSLIGLVQSGIAQKPKPAASPKPLTPTESKMPAAPREELLFTFGSDTVYKSEFERIYSKNNTSKEKPDEKSIREYLELYINFKLKVKEAKALGLDTAAAFKSELAGYRRQLAQPYLVDKKVTAQLVKEAYDHMKYEVNASHILVKCEENALPKDTLAAYKKAMDLRSRALKGESFDSLAVKNSDDPSAVNNFGNLGWFSAFQMIYAFEKGAYNTEPGKVSMPIRTRFGYHIIKTLDKRPARGEIKVAHIMVKISSSATAEDQRELKNKVDGIYAKLRQGVAFEDMVKEHSQDESSAKNKGELNWFSNTSNFPAEFKEAAFALKNNGDISEPVKTAYGWHLIKRLDKKEMQPLSELEESIKSKISRDSRSEQNTQAVIERIKKENNFTEYPAAYKEIARLADSTLLKGEWDSSKAVHMLKPVFMINKQVYTQRDFAFYIGNYQTARPGIAPEAAMSSMYKDYKNAKLIEYEESNLDKKYDDFRNLVKEYHDGILLFDLTDKKVWSKAVSDTSGLKAYHERNKTKYMWKERYDVETYVCTEAKTAKTAQKMIASAKSADEIKKKLNTKNPAAVTMTDRKAEVGEDAMLDNACNKAVSEGKACQLLIIPGKVEPNSFIVIRGKLPPQPKDLKDVRGLVTSDYQAQLEKDWLNELRAKYPVKVEEVTVNKLFK